MAKSNKIRKGPTRRVFISMPADHGLDELRNKLKWCIVEEVKKHGYEPQIFLGPAGGTGLAAGRGWDLYRVESVIRRCVGAVLIGQSKWQFSTHGREFKLVTEYCHYEGAVAYTHRLPILALAERGIEYRVIFNRPGGLSRLTFHRTRNVHSLRPRPFAVRSRTGRKGWRNALTCSLAILRSIRARPITSGLI
jgi:hypothetical protein